MKSVRLFVIILSLLCVAFLAVAVQQFLGFQKEKSDHKATKEELTKLQQERDQTQKDLDDHKKAKTDLEAQLADIKNKYSSLQDNAESLAAQIAEERKAKENALAQLVARVREVEDIKTDFESEKQAHASIQDQYDKIKKEYDSLQSQLKTMKAANEDLSKKVEELQAGREVELDKIVVKPGAEAEGKVLVVNKEFNFIVVAAGNNKGVTPGVVFGVFRNGNLIAKAQVEKVYETMSAANIMPESGEIKEGDIAKAM